MTSTRISLITGGSRGLGRATAIATARAGGDVVITYRTGAAEASEVVAEVEALGRRAAALPLDTTDAAGIPAFVETLRRTLREGWGREELDGLVNNAGFHGATTLGDTDPATIDALFQVHVKGVYLLTEALAPMLAEGGRIVNLSSGLARFVNPGGHSVYAAMKGAVEVLTRYWASELGARGITVNTVAPGATATDFGGGQIRDNAQYRDAITSVTALGRVGEAEDIGGVIATLLTAPVGWVTAQRIEASGGAKI
ncbi:SDR family NAD(P)-dependent oxidoreductase [Homoserinibacter sp. YIM 151385]|uniref:SDR family NAD(P)-dependent oxidoreductase n=1 Tax=Homoserinibacter sp. YIM 151385 TaxID=2985506 RepID=UPI0022F07264|nr:SDR family oxidoreductase [Homoserinibacter sp. YIM 151385]WBU39203.1 SDR family oxidoreductase [Homoserinibacter sp. YIM 151385]